MYSLSFSGIQQRIERDKVSSKCDIDGKRKARKFRRWFWMLEGAGVAEVAPPPGTGPDAGPRIANPHTDLHPRTQGGVKHAIHRRRVTLVP